MSTNKLALISLIFVFLANIGLGVFVYRRDKKNPINISFSALTLSIALWIPGIFMVFLKWGNPEIVLFCGRIAFAAGTFMATSFAIFSIIFRYEKLHLAKKFINFLCPASVIFAIIALSPLCIKDVVFENNRMKAYYGNGAYVWALYEAVCWGLIVYNLGIKWKKGSGIEKLRMQYMFLGIVLTTTFMAVTNILIPLLMDDIKAGAYGPCFTMILMGCMAYAIVKHRLMDIKLFIRKGVAYSLLLTAVTAGTAVLVGGIPNAFPNRGLGQSIIISMLAGLFIVFALQSFSQNIKNMMNAFIFKDQLHYPRALSDFSQSVVKMLDLDKLLNLIFNTTKEAMKVDRASLWLLDAETKSYHPILSSGFSADDLKIKLLPNDKIISYLNNAREPIVREEMEKNLSLEDFDRIETFFRRMKAEILIPLSAEGKLIGILNLGSKSSGKIYYEEDVSFLKAISDQSSIAIENAKLHQQVVNMRNYNEAILENLTTGIIAINSSYMVTTANPAAEKILELDINKMINANVELLPECIQNFLVKTIENSIGFRDIEINITIANKEKTLLISTTALEDEKQNISGAIAVFSDISVLKAIEKDAYQKEKLASLGRLAAQLAHEIKNPLLTIKTSFELLMEHQCEEELDRDFLKLAISETDRINGLLRQLLKLARPDPPDFAWCNINQVLDETILMLKNKIINKKIKIVDLRSDNLADIYADSNQLKQMFLNIGLNALESMENDGRLIIEAYTKSLPKQLNDFDYETESYNNTDSVIVKISDTGKGMSKEEIDKIFEPFYTTKDIGTGLGLAIVRNIIREHKCNYRLESNEGVGTSFIIEFPLISENAELIAAG